MSQISCRTAQRTRVEMPKKRAATDITDYEGVQMLDSDGVNPSTTPYDEVSPRQRVWTDDSYAAYGSRPCFRFFVLPFLILSFIALTSGGVLAILAWIGNAHTSFSCPLTHVTPIASIFSCLGVALLCVLLVVCTRWLWWARSNDTASDNKCRNCGFRVLVVILFLIAIAGGVGASIVNLLVYQFSTQQAPLSKDYTISAAKYGGLPSQPVRIVRDGSGLTHIQGATRDDVTFGQGFAQAQDRLWQMEFFRLVAQGVLAEHVGEAGIKIDKQIRTLGVTAAAQRMCALATADTTRHMQAFVSGVNAYLAATSHRPVEFRFMAKSWWILATHEPEPYTVNDVCYAAKLLQLKLGGNLDLEIERFRMWWAQGKPGSFGAGYSDINALYTNQSNISHTILDAADLNINAAMVDAQRARDATSFALEEQLYETYFQPLRDQAHASGQAAADEAARRGRRRIEGEFDLFDLVEDRASNAWAARRGGSSAYRPCGASDPHLEINLPSVWYYNHLTIDAGNGPTWESSGVCMTGIPGVHIGKTLNVSWGITMAITDIQDVFIAVPDPANPDARYIVNGTSLPYTLRTETITYKKGLSTASETFTVKETVYGPDVGPLMEMPTGIVASLWTPILLDDATSCDAVAAFMDPTVDSVQQLCAKVFSKLRSPAFSVPSADSAGNLGYCISGVYRQRPVGHTGMWPTIGNGTLDPPPTEIPNSALPSKFIPSSTIEASLAGASIATANQKIYPDGYPYALGYDYVPPFRGARIQTLLRDPTQANSLSSTTFHQSVQSDTQSNVWMLHLHPMFMAKQDQLRNCLTDSGTALLDSLIDWDGYAIVGSAPTSNFWGWLRAMSAITAPISDAVDATPWSAQYTFVPQLLLGQANRSASAYAFSQRLCQSALAAMPTSARYCVNTPDLSPCWALAAAKLNEASTDGNYMNKPWGSSLARLSARNLMMHGSMLECMFDRTVDKDGDPTSIDVNDFGFSDNADLTATHASSVRQLYDWGNRGFVRIAWPGGASGYPYADRYDNLLAGFAADTYVTVAVEGGVAAVSSTTSQTLNPG
jgi:penicillin amidase